MVDLDKPSIQLNPPKLALYTYHSHNTLPYIPFKSEKLRNVGLSKKQTKHRIETTVDEEVAMVFSSSNLILCPPFSTETQVKKIPPLS